MGTTFKKFEKLKNLQKSGQKHKFNAFKPTIIQIGTYPYG